MLSPKLFVYPHNCIQDRIIFDSALVQQFFYFMFKLPSDSCPLNKFQSFAAYVFNSNARSIRESSSSLIHRKCVVACNSDKKDSKKRLRPQTSQSRARSANCHSRQGKQGKDMGSMNFSEGILISPSNRKFKYCVNEPNSNNIDSKLANSNFLLQPCKIQSIPIKPRRELFDQMLAMECLKYSCPGAEKPRYGSELGGSIKLRNRSARQSIIKSNSLRREELIEPWQISECHFESIKLNSKN